MSFQPLYPRCPDCGAFMRESCVPRGCPLCGYRGDMIAPGHQHLFGCVEWRSDGTMSEVEFTDLDCVCRRLAQRRRFRVIEGGKKP